MRIFNDVMEPSDQSVSGSGKILYILLCKIMYSVQIKGKSREHPLTTYKPQAVGGQSEDIVFNRTSGGFKAGNK